MDALALDIKYQSFDSDDYLRTRFYDSNIPDRVLFLLDSFHEAFLHLPSRSLKILDYGVGPVVMNSISAAAHASELVWSDYSEKNLETLRKWLGKDPTAFNWSPFFDNVVKKLEGKSEKEAREREEVVRQVVKVAHCDINADPPIQKEFVGPYDVVIDSGCLAVACYTKEKFRIGLSKVSGLLKVGGTFMMYEPEFRTMEIEAGEYTVGSEKYPTLCLTGEYLAGVLKEQGFTDVNVQQCSLDPKTLAQGYQFKDMVGWLFVTAIKE